VVAINDYDLIADYEVPVPAPLGMDPDERRGNLHHMHGTWHGGANADGEVGVVEMAERTQIQLQAVTYMFFSQSVSSEIL
jgi:hypothetical protein